MNKIPIVSLLNPSPNESLNTRKNISASSNFTLRRSNYECDNLHKLRNELLNLHTKIRCTNIDNQEINRTLNKVLHGLKTLSTETKYSTPDRVVIQNISQLTAIIVKLVKKRENFIHYEKGIIDLKETSNDKCGIIFNVVTKDMMENGGKGVNSYKGHRLPKQYVLILENWYRKHVENPYLNDNDIRYLMRETGFSRSQVKNWVANKRRKDKHSTISPELSDLLAN
ncbi:HCL581Cp [Eremothecium sinecaudum]|uniref:HCL581Cp n=1 Tax=Eremothecium sinecaudum TaxID=45286 RepID=A0A109UXT0_9SACH|nr:HCL687Wp [Eremothecium sinecaudum]XP_017986566.1 HCL581Cp [Eremothecium sinecaudum]AMD19464.1 HCL687Wp [Eremothecium sinecaudum]AMD19570.1 HCL581Cp [Eremothecium sinecaudum]